MMPKNRVAVLHSVDSYWGLSFMPMGGDSRDERGRPKADYLAVEDQLHRALYDMNVGADFVVAEEPDFAGYDVLVVPPLYVASDGLLEKIAAFAKNGGHVLLAPRAGFTDEFDTVRWVRMPGPLREACGFSYQEFSSLYRPLNLKGDPFAVGAEANTVSAWAEMILPEKATPLAFATTRSSARPGADPQPVRQGERHLSGHDPDERAAAEGGGRRAEAGGHRRRTRRSPRGCAHASRLK